MFPQSFRRIFLFSKNVFSKDLLTSTFTLVSHERGIKTSCVPPTYPECVYCVKRYRYERFNVECHMDPNIGKSTDRERTVAPCKESLPTSCGPHRKRFLEVQTEIRAHMVRDKNTFLQEEAASAQRNLISVGWRTTWSITVGHRDCHRWDTDEPLDEQEEEPEG